MLKEKDIVKFARALSFGTWYTPTELDAMWGVGKAKRRAIVPNMNKRSMINSRGKTANIQYRLNHESHWKITTIEPTGNGVIDAKLRKEAKLPETPSSLENLISAATKVGSENEILKQALREIHATITKVQEFL